MLWISFYTKVWLWSECSGVDYPSLSSLLHASDAYIVSKNHTRKYSIFLKAISGFKWKWAKNVVSFMHFVSDTYIPVYGK